MGSGQKPAGRYAPSGPITGGRDLAARVNYELTQIANATAVVQQRLDELAEGSGADPGAAEQAAYNWANANENVQVSYDGKTGYSAFHWKEKAADSAAAASGSADAAALSASTASGHADTAAIEAGNAATSAGEALNSANLADGYKDQAATSELNASNSASAAEGYKDDALAYRNTTLGYRDVALDAAGDASGYALSASNSADSASGSATTATTKAQEASNSASAASDSETQAESYKNLAAASESTTRGYRDQAATSELNASNSASAADGYKDVALGAAGDASGYALTAGNHEGAAYDWANAGYNVDVSYDGKNGKSAYHWAQVAQAASTDADTLDGYDSIAFPRKAEAATITGFWTIQNNLKLRAGVSRIQLLSANEQNGWTILNNSSDSANFGLQLRSTTGGSTSIHTLLDSNGMTVLGHKVWTAGNDGAGSGLDADTVQGLTPVYIPDMRKGFGRCNIGNGSGQLMVVTPNQWTGLNVIEGKGINEYFRDQPGGTLFNGATPVQIMKSGWWWLEFQIANQNALANSMPANQFAAIVKSDNTVLLAGYLVNAVNTAVSTRSSGIRWLNQWDLLLFQNRASVNLNFWNDDPSSEFTLAYMGT
jgi:hypothetical protein